MDARKDTPFEKRVGLFNGLHRHRGACVEEGALVTRPVGVLDPAPPKGCSCVELMTDSNQIPKPEEPPGAYHRIETLVYLGSNLAPTWSNFGPNLVQHDPKI